MKAQAGRTGKGATATHNRKMVSEVSKSNVYKKTTAAARKQAQKKKRGR